MEKELDFKLILDEEDFGITKTKPIPKPFKKDQIVEVIMKCKGRYPNEILAAAMQRSITIINYNKFRANEKVKVKITGDKHNIFFAKVV